jgi:chromosome segregation ATPase
LPESLVREILEKEEWKEGYKNIDLNYQQREIYIESLTDDLVKKDSEIRSLNSKIDCMQCGLDTLQAERAEVDLLQQELEERISREANILAQEQLEKERLGLEKKQKELDKQSKELQSDLEAVKKTKQNLNHFSDWLLTLEQFNHSFNEHTQYLISVFRKLQDLPKVEELEADDLANQKIYNTIREFHDNSDAFGRALTNLHGALRKVDNTVLKTIDVDKEVL